MSEKPLKAINKLTNKQIMSWISAIKTRKQKIKVFKRSGLIITVYLK